MQLCNSPTSSSTSGTRCCTATPEPRSHAQTGKAEVSSSSCKAAGCRSHLHHRGGQVLCEPQEPRTVHCSWLEFSCAFEQSAFFVKFFGWWFGFFCYMIIKSLTFRLRSKYAPKKIPQKPCVWRRHWFLTTQTWPPSRKVDLRHCVEQKQNPSPDGFDTTEKRSIQTG